MRTDDLNVAAAATEDSFSASVLLSIGDITKFLTEALGRSLVLQLTGVTDPKAPARWASGEVTPRVPVERRLRTAYRLFSLLSQADTEYAARAWFIGLNPQLDNVAPISAIAEDHLKDVIVAAESFARTG